MKTINISTIRYHLEEISMYEITKISKNLNQLKNNRYKYRIRPINYSKKIRPISRINNGCERFYSQKKNRLKHNFGMSFTYLEYWRRKISLFDKSTKRKDRIGIRI